LLIARHLRRKRTALMVRTVTAAVITMALALGSLIAVAALSQ